MAGKRGGYRPNAGRGKGVLNKATIEREKLAQRILAEQQGKPGKKLAREVLDDFMHLFTGLAAMHQPLPEGVVPMQGQKPDPIKFMEYAKAAVDVAGQLAPYQSPRFKAVMSLGEYTPGGAPLPAPSDVTQQVESMTAQQAYRLLRDSDVIDITPNAKPAAAVVPIKKGKRA